MKKGLISILCASAIALIGSSGASAAPFLFNFSGPSGTAIFQLDSNPTPDYVNTFLPGTDQFGFNNVSGKFNGTPGTASTINFGEGIYASLNIVAPGLGFTQFSGPTLFTGSPYAPVFSTGTFMLINPFFGNGTLTIAQAGAVPEPAAWTLMLCGFGATGIAMRGRRKENQRALAGPAHKITPSCAKRAVLLRLRTRLAASRHEC